MNRNFTRLIPAMALALILAAPGFAQSATPAAAAAAAAPGAGKVAIINIQSAIVTSNEGQRDFQELQKKFDPKRQELEALNKDIEELQKKFTTQGDKLSDEARGALMKDIDAKKKQMQRSYEDANSDVQAQQNEIANRIGTKMIEVLDKFAKENGYSVVLDISAQQSPVLWAASSIDITKPIIEAYNTASGVPAQPKSASEMTPATGPKLGTKSTEAAAKK